ncbi:hypothetical protein U1Q18_047740, partial [Sarracenia purpurea var. burkii]
IGKAKAEAEEGLVVTGGGPKAHNLHSNARPWLLELRPIQCRVAEEWKELQTPVDKLPEARTEERDVYRTRGGNNRDPS